VESFEGVDDYIPANFSEGELRVGVRSASGCESACRSDSTCIRFAFVTDRQLVPDIDRVCYLFFSTEPLFIEQPGGTVYLRRKCLPLSTCTATTGTSKLPVYTSASSYSVPTIYNRLKLLIMLYSESNLNVKSKAQFALHFSMYDLISDVISNCALSWDMDKIRGLNDKISIKNQ